MPWLEGRLSRVVWSSERSGYAIVRVKLDSGDAVAVGTLASLTNEEPGVFVSLEGEWEEHPVHGRQFRVSGLLQATPQTLAGLELWLAAAGVRGIGPALSARIVDRFGLDLVRILEQEPTRLAEVKGIGAARAAAIREAWARDDEGRALTMLLRGLGLSQRLADRIRERYGDRSHHVVRTAPFTLAEEVGGIGFRTADALARAQGLAEDDPARVRAAVVHVLDAECEQQGHSFLHRAELSAAVRALGVPVDGLDDAIAEAEGTGRIAVERRGGEDDRVYTGALHQAEVLVASELGVLAERARSATPDRGGVADAARWVGIALDPSQEHAVARGLSPGVVVVTGGPGTGKTTLLKVLLRVARERGATVKLASPTGRAARRLAEATGLEASTIHRLLEYNPAQGGFQRGLGKPLEADTVVIDEVSMVDLPLMAALLEGLATDRPDLSIVLVGDADQIPSVGPGQVLRDLVDSGAVPVARLTTLHRQALDSGIVRAARDVHAGQVPRSGERSGRDDVFLLARTDPEDAVQTLLKVVSERLPANGFDPLDDVQVLAPTRKGPLGTERLNRELQQRLNPGGLGLVRGEREIRIGDRVVCTKNRYDVEVFNGDVGRVRDAREGSLEIDFDGRIVPWGRDELSTIDLAYALTVHKAQGGEYPAVVLALHSSHGIMLRRNLFYTAITRARRFLCVVGSPDAWRRAAANDRGDERYSALAERLRA